ncbi:hypothetical protein ABBQ32_008892 [Trebouxia sp. C0010 RCD-2024]
MSTGGFGLCFIGKSFPISDSSFVRVDPSHWVFDVSNVTPNYRELQEVSLFLVQSGTLDPTLALGLYISIGGAEWQYRGYVSNTQPSEVMPLQWPEQDQPLNVGPGVIQLGVSLEPLAEVVQKEGTKLASRQEFAKRVALDLFRYMESFNSGSAGDTLVLPSNVLERWFSKFEHNFRRDPDFLVRRGEMA